MPGSHGENKGQKYCLGLISVCVLGRSRVDFSPEPPERAKQLTSKLYSNQGALLTEYKGLHCSSPGSRPPLLALQGQMQLTPILLFCPGIFNIK